jgi:hypothetical protein
MNREEEEKLKKNEISKKKMVQEKIDLTTVNKPTMQIIEDNKFFIFLFLKQKEKQSRIGLKIVQRKL